MLGWFPLHVQRLGCCILNAAFQLNGGNIHFTFSTGCKWDWNCAGWLYVLTFATIKAKGRHYSSKNKNYISLQILTCFTPFFFFFYWSEISVYSVKCSRIWWGILPWRKKSAFLFNTWLCSGVQCMFMCTRSHCCRTMCLWHLCLLSCLHWFPLGNSSMLPFIYLISRGLFVSSLLKYQWSMMLFQLSPCGDNAGILISKPGKESSRNHFEPFAMNK